MNSRRETATLTTRTEATLNALRKKAAAVRQRFSGDEPIDPPFNDRGDFDQVVVFRALAHDIQMLGARLHSGWQGQDAAGGARDGARAFLPQGSRYAVWAKQALHALRADQSGEQHALSGAVAFLVYTNALLADATRALAAGNAPKVAALYAKLEAITCGTKAPTPRSTEPSLAFTLMAAQEALDAAMLDDVRARCLSALARDVVVDGSFLTEEYEARALFVRVHGWG